MKRLISTFIILGALFVALPSYAMWYCTSSNERYATGNCPSCQWYWHACTWYGAHNGALNACQQSGQTLNPGTCQASCYFQPTPGQC